MLDIEAEFKRNPKSENALRVVQKLHQANFQAYLVGGCVRDLLLGQSPKDFDVATDAHPEAIRTLFSGSRLIGRRFQIVHVRFGRDIIEVTTFRAPAQGTGTKNVSDGGMLLSDNVYGTFEQDVVRRDFTINALYYDPQTNQISDLVDGRADIEKKTIRLIGEPEQRFREDPVRMLRAARFEAKLGFDVEDATAKSIQKLGFLLKDIPPARLFEEVLKLFMSGHGEASLKSLAEHDLLNWLFPLTGLDESDRAYKLIELALASTDRRIGEGLPVTPAFILAALLWWPYNQEKQRLIDEGSPPLAASHEAAISTLIQQQFRVSIPRRFSGNIRDIWHLQSRLPNTRGKKPAALILHKRFRAAYDFLLLRESSGEDLNQLGDWWTRYQEQNPVDRTAQKSPPSKRRTRSRNRRPRPAS